MYRDALWDKDTLVVFCDAKAGTGKTLIAGSATGMIARGMNRYNALTYLTAVARGRLQAFSPERNRRKASYAQPLYDALIT